MGDSGKLASLATLPYSPAHFYIQEKETTTHIIKFHHQTFSLYIDFFYILHKKYLK
jgi:hypothetical protein